MKLKVTDVVTMAWNDHRISLENEDVKAEITVKDSIHSKNSLMELKTGDEVELPITVAKKTESKAKPASKKKAEE